MYCTVGMDQVFKILCFHHTESLVYEFIQEQNSVKERIYPQLSFFGQKFLDIGAQIN